MIISIEKKSIWQNPIPIYDKNSEQTRDRGELPQPDEVHLQRNCSYHTWWEIQNFPTKIRNKARMVSLTTSFQIVLEVLAKAVRQEKGK